MQIGERTHREHYQKSFMPMGMIRRRDAGAGIEYQVCDSQAPDDPEWDHFLASTPGGHYVQSSAWAQLRAISGWRATRLTLKCDGRIVAGAQLFTRSFPLIGSVGYIPKGLLIAPDQLHAVPQMISALHRVARAQRVQYLAVQPPASDPTLTEHLYTSGFRPNPKLGTATATVRIDLDQTLEAIRAGMKKRTRANIRRGLEQGVTVREGTEADITTFYSLLTTASRRKGFPIHSRDYYTTLWQVLAPHGHIKLFVAEYEEEPVSALLAIPFGDTVYTHVSAWSGVHGSLKPNEVIEWASITWAKEQGYRYYDFEGINPTIARAIIDENDSPDSTEMAADRMVTRYKLGFGGQITLLPGGYDYVYNPVLRWGYQRVLPQIEHLPVVQKVRKAVERRSQQPLTRSR